MKLALIGLLFAALGISTANAADVEGFGVIREFGGTDTAALFGLLPGTGKLLITAVSGPTFLGGVRQGELTQAAIDHLFLKSSNPMSQQEKLDLITRFQGAQVIYFEGYNGNLCRADETGYEISATGTLDGSPFSAKFQFIALPNSAGDCKYRTFFTSVQS